MNPEEQKIGETLVAYGRKFGVEMISEIHVHGLCGAFALLVGHWGHELKDGEVPFILLSLVVLLVTCLTFLIRRRIRAAQHRHQLRVKGTKLADDFVWTNHL